MAQTPQPSTESKNGKNILKENPKIKKSNMNVNYNNNQGGQQ